MPHDVIMPQMGESIAEGTITTWLKSVGDSVKRDEPLFEISTDKVDAEIPAPVSGELLEIKAQPGETVPINSVVAIISGQGESAQTSDAPVQMPAPAANTAPATTASSPATAPAPSPAPSGNGAQPPRLAGNVEERRRVKSSPVVRKIAAEHGVDITQLQGSGISGRVTKSDILAYVEGGGAKAAPAATPFSASSASIPMVSDGTIPESFRPRMLEGDTVEELSTMRSKIADHMIWSRRISAHVQSIFDVDYSHVAKLRTKYKALWQERHGVKLTFTHFIMKAIVDALKQWPVLNASLDGQRVIYHRDVNLGMAVALDWGLIVPVIRRANELNLLGLARRTTDLGERARTKKLKPEDVQGGTFTLTNPGQFGNLFGIPIINQPQVAIIGAGGIEKRPVVIDDAIAIRTRGYLSISFDHRLVDGAVADQFMAMVKRNLQEFDESEL